MGFSTLDEQINALNALHISSAKTLDNFADTSRAIAERARRITADVQPWEIAQENIASTIEEMSRAARCYHPPPSLRLVLARKEKKPEALCKCIDYLVFTDNYLASHPPNPYADQIAANIAEQLNTVVKVAEDTVKESFITALQKDQLAREGDNEKRTTSTHFLIHKPEALNGIDKVIHRLGENFNRTDVVSVDVKQLLGEHMLRTVNSLLESCAKEDEIQPYSTITVRHGVAPMRKNYQKGSHYLLAISSKARQLVTESSDCLKRYVLDPLNDSFDVVEIPSELGTMVFDCVKDKCFSAIEVNEGMFSDPTRMFVLSRGEGIGLFGVRQNFRDIIFVGLELLEDLWKWKLLAESLPGDNHNFLDHVDNVVEKFLFEVRDLLDFYVTCKGSLEPGLLKEYTRTLHRTEWYPSLDCSAHVSVTNQVYLHKVLLTNYYGAMKLALHGSLLNTNAESRAVQEVEDYMMRCVFGTLRDLEVIAETAQEIQLDAMEDVGSNNNNHNLLQHLSNFHLGSNSHHAKDRSHLISPAIFMLNNIIFFIESYRKEACFHQRRLILEKSIDTKKKNTSRGKQEEEEEPSVPIVSNIIAMLEDEKRRYVDEFAASWSGCFPPISTDPRLASFNASTEELNKSQRMAVKHWYRDTAEALTKRIDACRNFAVLDASQRNALIEASVVAVREEFNLMELKLGGKTWSDRPLKWMVRDVEQWTDLLNKLF
ncbi:uncharacterized protein TM35_000041520 [Trypanosoma theileri]|uniref:Exocyst subunit Exo70 family protein n=1 Tax=Trypanosoma theileri TaxID=67003 RepID=A0A1X0P526_9TRYP|nr:uncharacterized protein TM35_000041520 [Trypanosoma theileri]ORC91938.1 hypothetical protein TM35_000041520 [Trypanosoma theileri]